MADIDQHSGTLENMWLIWNKLALNELMSLEDQKKGVFQHQTEFIVF